MPTELSHPESLAPWAQALGQSSTAAERIRAWWEQANKACPAATLRAWRFDWAVYLAYCSPRKVVPLPASAEAVAAFVESCHIAGKKPATIRRYLATVALAHRVARLENPCADELVQLAIKGLYAAQPARQRQARALGRAEIMRFLDTAGDGLRAARERALLTVAYDTLARRSELVALDLEDVEFLPDGTGRALIRRSKTDQTGQGSSAYLSRETVQLLQGWLSLAHIDRGALFRRLIGRSQVGERLSADAIAEIFKRVGRWVGMTPTDVNAVSGHSVRVGATQDLLALNIDLASVMQAGRWTTSRMPMRYGEQVLASRGGMARAASAQGR